MTAQLTLLDTHSLEFPDQALALREPDGLLAVGGDLSSERLIKAYQQGIFPWFNPGEPIMWWCPSERAVLPVGELKISKSLRKLAKKDKYRVFINRQFPDVINACIEQRIHLEGTWITHEMKHAYNRLHALGFAHSVEVVNDNNELVGGLYGIMSGGIFCGESMFHKESNCSKLAFWALHHLLKEHNIHLIDCQIENPHLNSLGVISITREEFLTKLKEYDVNKPEQTMWQARELNSFYD